MRQGAELRDEELHLNELGLAQLAQIYVNFHRDRKKTKPYEIKDFCLFTPAVDKEKLDPVACDVFFTLAVDKLLSQEIVAVAPVQEMRQARVSSSKPKVRAWMGEGILLLTPRVVEDVVRSPLVLVNGVGGLIEVADVDSGTVCHIEIENENKDSYWETECEFELAEASE